MPDVRVTLIEDERLARETCLADLKNVVGISVTRGYATVEEFLSSKDAEPDVVMLDLELPGGHIVKEDAYRAIKQLWPQTKVLVVTRSPSRSDVLSMLSTGAEGYVTKSDATTEELGAAILKVASGLPYMPARVAAIIEDSDKLRKHPLLSHQETQVVRLVADGFLDKEIAKELGISVKTVQRHLENVHRKTGRRRRADLTRLAVSRGMVSRGMV